MADTEDYFPRGGKKPQVTHFKQTSNFLGVPEKTERKKKKLKRKHEGDDGYLSDDGTNERYQLIRENIISLSYKTIKPGLLILGRVQYVLDMRVMVMLPGRMIGNIMVCHVSEPYNKVLEAYVNDKVEKVRDLPSMFRSGQYVALKVMEVEATNVMLSAMPQHVNSGKNHADLRKGAIIQAAVSSVEDHGYVMDIGIANTRAFLPKNEANPEIELDTGMVTWCTVKSVTAAADSSIVTLTSTLETLQEAVVRRKPDTALLPGSAVQFTVDLPLDQGIRGQIFDDTTAYILRQHVDKVKGKKPNLGQKVIARVLYVMPTSNTPFLTMKNIFETTYPDMNEEQKLRNGEIVEDAQVLRITGRAIHFKLGQDSFGMLSLRRIQIDEELTDEEVVAKSYPIGSSHKVRVLCYNMSDYTYSVSDEPALVNEKYFSLEHLEVGQLVEGTVHCVVEGQVLLTVGRVKGRVPQAHLTDAGFYVDPKKGASSNLAKNKYKVGQEVRARVLSVNPLKQMLYLTLKPSLLAPDLEILRNYEDAAIGKGYIGTIKYIKDCVIVSFFDNVVAYVARHYVTKEALDNLMDAFHIGQIVTCTILRVDLEAKKMWGSLTTKPFWPAKKREKGSEKRKINPDSTIENHKNKKLASRKQKLNNNADESEITCEEIIDEAEAAEIKEVKKKKKRDRKLQEDIDSGHATEVMDDTEVSVEKEAKKKKKKRDNKPEEEIEIENETEVNIVKEGRKRKKRDSKSEENVDSENVIDIKRKKKGDTTLVDTSDIKERDKKKKTKKKKVIDEKTKEENDESDAIETDFNEDSDQILTPQEMGLVDLSDCVTGKNYKKRVGSLVKAIDARRRQMRIIDKKIDNIEEIGLDANNKKFHSAMHSEKLMLEERTNKLSEALNIAQKKLKECGMEEVKELKKNKREPLKDVSPESVEETEESVQDTKKKVKDSKKVAKEKKEIKEVKRESKQKNEKDSLKKIQTVNFLGPALEVPSAKEFWSATAESLSKNVMDDSSSSSEDEQTEQPKKKRKKLSVAEKLAKAREEEERVREMERRAIESESQPRSSEQFERALLANPDCSQLWIAYMAFHLQATEIEKARAVAKKALTTISFREELEKLNVWLALLNLETRFGTKESQQKTLEEALQMNDTYKVHSKLLDIYVETGKHQDLSALVDLMLRKYKHDPKTYIGCGGACFSLGLVEKARHVMQRAIAVLEKKEHVTVLVQFALLERSHGNVERAEALFEQVLAVYPQRVDVCSTYIDMLTKIADIDRIRQVMERMTSHKLPARKMKVLYKKWIEVEEKMGDERQTEKIRQLALDYVEKAKF